MRRPAGSVPSSGTPLPPSAFVDETFAVDCERKRVSYGGILEGGVRALVQKYRVIVRRPRREKIIGRSIAAMSAGDASAKPSIWPLLNDFMRSFSFRKKANVKFGISGCSLKEFFHAVEPIGGNKAVGSLVVRGELIGTAPDRFQVIIGKPPISRRNIAKNMFRNNIEIFKIIAEEGVGGGKRKLHLEFAHAVRGNAFQSAASGDSASGFWMLSTVKMTSSLVSCSPSCQWRFSLRRTVHVFPSGDGGYRVGDVRNVAIDHFHDIKIGLRRCRDRIHVFRLANDAFGVFAACGGHGRRRSGDEYPDHGAENS